MKTLLLIWLTCLCFLGVAQNEAYYLSSEMNIKKVDLETNRIIAYYDFLDTMVVKHSGDYLSSPNSQIAESLPVETNSIRKGSYQIGSLYGFEPYFALTVDSIYINGAWHIISIFQTDDHFVGGSPNSVTTDITIHDLGKIYSYANWTGAHLDIMLWLQDPAKQELLIKTFELIKINYPQVIDSIQMEGILRLAQQYHFDTLIDVLTQKWLAPRKDLKLVQANTTVINGQINYAVIVKNISTKGYYFLEKSEFGPAIVEYQRKDVGSIMSRVDGAYHGSRYHYHFQNIGTPLYVAPGQEFSFVLTPNWRENCGTCSQFKYYGLQVYRYGIDFFYWMFSNDIVFGDNAYTLYHLQEIE